MRGLNVLCESTELVWSCASKALDLDSLTPEQEASIIDTACFLVSKKFIHGEELTSPESATKLLNLYLGNEKNECFVVLYLNNQNQLLQAVKHFQGTIDGAAVYPRILIQEALQVGAAAVILGHNHPSGSTEASTADVSITKRIEAALDMVDIRLLDHLVVGKEVISMKTEGLI